MSKISKEKKINKNNNYEMNEKKGRLSYHIMQTVVGI